MKMSLNLRHLHVFVPLKLECVLALLEHFIGAWFFLRSLFMFAFVFFFHFHLKSSFIFKRKHAGKNNKG